MVSVSFDDDGYKTVLFLSSVTCLKVERQKYVPCVSSISLGDYSFVRGYI